MDDQSDPADTMDNENIITTDAAASDSDGDDDLMGAIGIDLGGDETPPTGVELQKPELSSEEQVVEGQDDGEPLDPYQIGANVAANVRQLVSDRLDRMITVAVEQAVVKELRRIKGKVE